MYDIVKQLINYTLARFRKPFNIVQRDNISVTEMSTQSCADRLCFSRNNYLVKNVYNIIVITATDSLIVTLVSS